jgi:hypothetical protein
VWLVLVALPACGRVGYATIDADGTLDASGLDASGLDASGLDASGLDTGALDTGALDATPMDAPLDAPSTDAGRPDAGPPMPLLPLGCTRGALPSSVSLPTVPMVATPPERRIVSAIDTDALTMALATAMPGDVIELEPGVTYRSAYVVSRGDVTLRTRGIDDVALPTRIGPADAPSLARIVTGGALSSLTIDASNVRVSGLEIATDALDAPAIVRTGVGRSDILLDRLYVHGSPLRDVRAGIEIDGPRTTVRRSDVREIHAMAGPRPAILLFTCGGPVAIVDNHLEAAGEGVVLGTENALTAASSPHDVAICQNHVTRSLAWYPLDASYAGIEWPTGPLIGLYNGERVLVAGNVLERAWESAGGSGARAIALGPGDFAPAGSAHVSDVVIAWNHVRDVPEDLSFFAGDAGLAPLARVRVTQSLFEPISASRFPADTGRILQLLDGPAGRVRDLVIDHVTAPGSIQNGIVAESTATAGELEVRDSILSLGQFGFLGGSAEGIAGLAGLHHLALVGRRAAASYGATSTVVPTLDDVGFVRTDGIDWALAATSPFLTTSSSGGAVGCNVAMLRTVLAGVAP